MLALALVSGSGCASSESSPATDAGAADSATVLPCTPDESAPVPERASYDTWTLVELPGTSCSDGSPYRFFANYSHTSNNVLIMFEYGASCWDYESCSRCGLSTFCQSAKLAGFTNNTGISTGHMDSHASYYALTAPSVGDPSAFRGWNIVYLPYCTGDMQMGSRAAVYTGADGTQLPYQHAGHDNMLLASSWIDQTFPTVPRLAVLGVSSGGTAALVNYHLLRSRIKGAQCGYLLNDSGPLFSSAGASGALHRTLQDAYNVEPLIQMLGKDLGPEAADAIHNDFGAWATVLAKAYPRDRLTTALFQHDLNYLFFSYDSIAPGAPYADLARAWQADLVALKAQHDSHANLAYFMPSFRPDNCSHALVIPPISHLRELVAGQLSLWFGTEIADDGTDLAAFMRALVNDAIPLRSHFEAADTDGEFGEDGIEACRTMGTTTATPLP